MRISAVFMLIMTIASAVAFSDVAQAQKLLEQKTSFAVQNKSLAETLDQLSSQTKVKFMYSA